jgi:Flp pilus assembly protein TadB
VADRLSRHYQEGRLDQAEFNERLDRAMNAKTRADFNGLFADLPDLPDSAEQQSQPGQPNSRPARMPSGRRSRTPLAEVLAIVGVVVLAIIVTHTVIHSWLLWLLLAALGFVWLRNEEHRRRR